jgi:hypothetical protein
MSATFNRSRIMQAAHFTARYRVATFGGSYREWFAKALSWEWKKAKAAIARDESNVGLPVRTCFADAPTFNTRRLYTRASGCLAGSFAA